jgi:hypothetical protein
MHKGGNWVIASNFRGLAMVALLDLQKMLQSIAENSKNNDPSSKKSAEIDSKTAKNPN